MVMSAFSNSARMIGCWAAGVWLVSAVSLSAQPATSSSTTPSTQQDDDQLRIKLPIVTVTAEKEPEEAQKAPVAVTAVPATTLFDAAVRSVSDAGNYAPNVFFHEFSARKLSNVRFRGVGSSPSNPGVTTYIDGVPQLHANTSSIELADVEQVEFVRGPQSALYGRNAIGGLINITSARPAVDRWGGQVVVPFGNFSTVETRGTLSGPVNAGTLAMGISFGYSGRDGYTVNDVTGNDLDSRSALFAKTQLLWTPSADWEARVILSGERARDGDYALTDLGAARANPFHVSRDYEGFTHRDIVSPTLQLRRAGQAIELSSTTGLVWWNTTDSTDLDYSPLSLATRSNDERDVQFTQEVRVASAKNAPIAMADAVSFAWQAGATLFTQNYEQDAINNYSPFVLSPFIPIPVSQLTPHAELDDVGFGLYGRGSFTFANRLEGTVGVRADFENKQALLDTSFTPAIAPPVSVRAEESFSDVSPQFTVSYQLVPDRQTVYATASRGFKAGGFNAASLPGREAYGEEHSWSYEAGVKTLLFNDRLAVNAAVFFLDWTDLQVNVPNPFVPGQFYIDNAAGATSKGVEVDMTTRLFAGCDFFAGFGYSNARFDDGSVSSGVTVGGNRLANTPNYTADFGGQYAAAITPSASLYARAEVAFRGDYHYDDANTQGQDAYSLTTIRGGVRGSTLFAEAWIRNAFDTRYVPIAFAYPGLAPSGFVGESGAPRTFGIRAGVTF
jgi:iron complex outermembrane receptor protein